MLMRDTFPGHEHLVRHRSMGAVGVIAVGVCIITQWLLGALSLMLLRRDAIELLQHIPQVTTAAGVAELLLLLVLLSCCVVAACEDWLSHHLNHRIFVPANRDKEGWTQLVGRHFVRHSDLNNIEQQSTT